MGYTIFTCDCGDTYKGNYTDKIPHDYEKKVTPATCEEMGYTVYDCKNCDDTYTSDYTDIIPHNYKSEITAATLYVKIAAIPTRLNMLSQRDILRPIG